MKTPVWMKTLIALLLLLVAGLGLLSFQLMSKLSKTQERLAIVEEDILDLAHPDGATRAAAKKMKQLSTNGVETAEAVKELDDRIGAVLLKARANSKRLDALEAGNIEDLGLGEMMGSGGAQAGGFSTVKGERNLNALGDKLQLTELQKQRVAILLNEAKEDAYGILEAARDDDPEFVEAVGGILQGGGNLNQKARKILPKLFSSNVPGTDESYFSALLDIRHNAIYGFRDILSQEQLGSFKDMKMDIFSIRTEYNPFSQEAQGGR